MKPILLTVHIQLCIIMSVSQKMKHQPSFWWERSTEQNCTSFTRNYKSGIKEKQTTFTWKWQVSLSRECNAYASEAFLSLGFSVNAASYFLLNLPTPQENPKKTKQTMENVKACSSYISTAHFFWSLQRRYRNEPDTKQNVANKSCHWERFFSMA